MKVLSQRVTYKNAPISTLEKLRFKDVQSAYKRFLDVDGLSECMIIQTCNRVEIFAIIGDQFLEMREKIASSWAREVRFAERELSSFLEDSEDDEALEHLLRLTSGLESMIVGEDQILGQVKDAFEAARQFGGGGRLCQLILDRAVKTGAKVRAHTNISKGSVSAGSAAVQIAEQILGQLAQRRALLIGAGEMGISVAKALLARGVSEIYVASRTYDRAKAFTVIVGGRPVEFFAAVEMLPEMDLVITATSAPYHLLTYEEVARACAQRSNALLIFDLSNPRNVDDKVKQLSNVRLLDIDHLRTFADENLESRLREVRKAESIVSRELENLRIMLKRQTVEPVIASIFRNAENIRKTELQKTLAALDEVGEQQVKVIDLMTQVLVRRLLSEPAIRLRTAAETGDSNLVSAAGELFGEPTGRPG